MSWDFLDEDHETFFFKLRVNMNEGYRFNEEYLSVLYLMSGNEELYFKMNKYFDTQEGFFKSNEMFEKEDFSSGIYILAKLAVHLFNNNESVTPLDLIATLDENNFNLALQSMILRKEGMSSAYPFSEEKFYS